jgi:multidrug resistance efflux pump
MTDREQSERERFEAWARTISPFHIFERYSEDLKFYAHMNGREVGDYTSEWTDYAWRAWQACASAKDARIAELQGICSDYFADFKLMNGALSAAHTRIAALEAQLAQAQADAERYRWLRDRYDGSSRIITLPSGMWDAAIDAASAQAKEGA